MIKDNQDWPNPWYAWYVVILLTIAFCLSYVDRQIFTLLIEPIRLDLQLSDTELSLLGGFAFVVFYVTLGIPMGRLADRFNRTRIIIGGLVVWSAMTCLCGLAKNSIQLFFARLGVGVGEAALAPAATSLISDYFPPEKRARPYALYMLAVPLGPGIAYFLGGAIIDYVSSVSLEDIPFIASLKPWQIVFIVVGFPGIIFSLLINTIKEPPRKGMIQEHQGGEVSFAEVMRFIFKDNAYLFLLIFISFGLLAMNMAAYLMWLPSFFIRTYGAEITDISGKIGGILCVSGVVGVLMSSQLVRYMQNRNKSASYLKSVFFFNVMMALIYPIFPLMPNENLAFLLLVPVAALTFTFPPVMPALAQAIVPNQMRGLTIGLFSFFNSVIGLALGPTLVALSTDYLFADPLALKYSLIIVSLVSLPLSAIMLVMAFKPFEKMEEMAKQWQG